jgi:two-component system chemotaxis response regulator CheY
VLVVDDSMFMRQLLKDIFNNDSEINIVGEANNGSDAVRLFKELKPDVTTLDIIMEGSSGITALEEIMKLDEKATVIMITSIGEEKYVKQCLDIGAKGFVLKPFDEEDVLITVKKAALHSEK